MERLPPQDVEAEMSVLGAMMLDSKAITKAVTMIGRKDFYRDAHGRIFQVIADLHKAGIAVDVVTIKDRLDALGILDGIGGIGYLIQLGEFVPTTANIAHYAGIVAEKSAMRTLLESCGETAGLIYQGTNPAQTVLNQHAKLVRELSTSFTQGKNITADFVSDLAVDALGGLINNARGILFGVNSFDNILNGLTPGTFTVIAGPPGSGKSVVMHQWALQCAYHKKHALMVSFEMPKLQITQRIICHMAQVDSQSIKGRRLDPQEVGRLQNAVCNTLPALPLTIVDDSQGFDVDSLVSFVEGEHAEGRCDVLFVDYLQIVRLPKDMRGVIREQQVRYIADELNALKLRLNIPVVALSQLRKRGANERKRKFDADDLRESGSIHANADNIVILNTLEEEKKEEEGGETVAYSGESVEFSVEKQRAGVTGPAKLTFDKRTGTFKAFDNKDGDANSDLGQW